MSVKSFSKIINSIEFIKKYESIISQFNKAYEKGIRNVPISCLLKDTGISQRELYNGIHDLLELEVLSKKEYSVCPYCLRENEVRKNQVNYKCSRCGKYYIPEYFVEKFKLIKVLINEEK